MRSRRIRILACSLLMMLGLPLTARADAQPLPDATPVEALPRRPMVHPAGKSPTEELPLGTDAQSEPGKNRPVTEPPSSSGFGLSRTLGALSSVVGLAIMCSLLWRWMAQKQGGLIAALGAGGRAPSGVIEVLARYPVARTQRLVLLRVGRRVILACQSSSVRGAVAGMTTLAEFTDADEVASILRSVRETDCTAHESAFRSALRELERAEPSPPLATSVEYSSRAGDTVQLSDPRVQIPRQPAPSGPIDPTIGLLRSRLAAMRARGDAA